MRLEKLFKVLVAGALLTPTLMCTSAQSTPPSTTAKPGLAAATAHDADVIASAATAIADAGRVDDVDVDQSEGVGSWLSW
jgi:hypothetical protein